MKAITIIQPWASLIAQGDKRFETRGWRTHYRGWLAIHAGKKRDKQACLREPFRSLLQAYGEGGGKLPSGAVVAVCRLTECYRVKKAPDELNGLTVLDSGRHRLVWEEEEPQLLFGDYAEERYAWQLSDIQPLSSPIPASGKQGLWEWEEPDIIERLGIGRQQ
ncbi:ASCH domain-containing protein [Paenibacillus sp. CN-4]|uniref:ASCH domain-containing protein n=1 Tax=Paenibacillus nanchangensis TaxID=3348343 RepID=UPI00397E7BF8